MAEVLSAKELAIELGCDARTCRKFLRDIVPPEEQPGQGGRWTFTPKQAKKLVRKFEEWNSAKTKRQTATAPEDVEELDDDVEELELEDDEVEELEDDDIEEI